MRRSSSSPRLTYRQGSRQGSSLDSVTSPRSRPEHPPLWKSPLLWLASLVVLIVGGLNFIVWYRTVPVIAILAADVSNSGFTDPSVGENICRAQTQALKPQDVALDIAFADTTEPTYSGEVRSATQMFSRCQSYSKRQRPKTVGNSTGTSPIVLLNRIQTQIQIQRKAGNYQPIAAVIWLQAAEAGPGLPKLDFQVLGRQIEQITNDRGRVTFIGPTGKLRENLERLNTQNLYLKVCSLAEHQTCIHSTFEAARALPAAKPNLTPIR